jgi:23S rRNA (adenine2503-C2)-methyltransferase
MAETNAARPLNLHDLTYQVMVGRLAEWGYSEYHARQLWDALYVDHTASIDSLAQLRPDLRQRLLESAALTDVTCAATVRSSDGQTVKYLLRLEDGQTIETVLMRYPGRAIACISTQVGCAMGCVFCATGQMGFIRQLAPGEIVAQVLFVARQLRRQNQALRNVVLMGMGEPLHNYQATTTALAILMDDRGLAIAPKHITLSTVGLPGGIRRLADDAVGVNLAVSLHAADDQARAELVPVAGRWPLSEIIDACRYYVAQRGRRIFFEWALIAGANDNPETAHHLGRLLQGLDAHVNLIPLNPTDEYSGRPSDSPAIGAFQSVLAEYGLPSTVRQRRGIDIDAGCGQLRARASRHDSQRGPGSAAQRRD